MIANVPRPFRPISEILTSLDIAAIAMLRIPSGFIALDILQDLHADIQAAIARPAEDERVIDEFADWLCRALIKMATPDCNAKWIRLAKRLHPEIQDDLRRAREEELRQMQRGGGR